MQNKWNQKRTIWGVRKKCPYFASKYLVKHQYFFGNFIEFVKTKWQSSDKNEV